MKAIRKIFTAIVALIAVVTLASCKSDSRNTTTPMGNLDGSTTIASIEGATLTLDEYYNRLRVTGGYNTFLEEIKKSLFEEEYNAVKAEVNLTDTTVTDTEREIFDIVASALFTTTNKETIENYTDDEIDTYVQKYIDTNNNNGITITDAQCRSYSFVEDEIVFNNLPNEIIENQLVNLAINKASKEKLETIVNNEKIEDKDGDKVTNAFYISDKNIQSKYEDAMMEYGTYSAIIVQFNNLTEARNAINAAQAAIGTTEINDTNVAKFYTTLYNTYYNYRTQLDSNNPFASTEVQYVVNGDKDELSKVSSTIKNFVVDTLEDGEYLVQPFNLNNKYVMIYRYNTTYDVNVKYNVAETNEVIEWAELKNKVGADNYNEIYNELRDQLIDTKVSTYTSTVLEDRIEAADIEIYDPLFELQFANTYADYYELIKKSEFNNDLLFELTYNNKTYSLSVEDFYNKQSTTRGVLVIVERLKLDYVIQYQDLLLEEEAINDTKSGIDKAVEAFEKGENASYPKSIGLETFLVANYGYKTTADAKKYAVAASALSEYIGQSVFDEWATEDHKLNTEKLNILENILNAGNANYNNLFSINIDHILIYIDDNSDGNPDDPKEFMNKLSTENQAKFNEAVLALSKAIYAEVNCKTLTDSNDLMEILNHIVESYGRNGKIYSDTDPNATWEKYKAYNFLLKVESLSASGDTTESNVSNYVPEFADYVENLYKKAVETELSVDEKNPVLFYPVSGTKAPTSIDDICATQFGYHMIIVNSYSEPDGTNMSESSDSYGYQKNFQVLINEKDVDTDEDNIYVVIENTYNDKTTEANMNQFFTYYVQNRLGATGTLDTNIEKLFDSMFGDAISKYISSAFQNFLLVNELNIQITDTTLKARFDNYKAYLIRYSEGYSDDTTYANWYNGSLDWSRPYQK